MRNFFSISFVYIFWALFVLPVLLIADRPFSPTIMIGAFFAVGVTFLAERYHPFNKKWLRSHGDIRSNTLHAIVNNTILMPYMALIFFLFLKFRLPFFNVWPRHWHPAFQIYLALFLADFIMTFVHYLSHKYDFLWRFHSTHHSVKRIYGLNGLMKHPLHKIFEATLGFGILFFLGIPFFKLGGYIAYVALMHFLLSHLNVDIRNFYLSRVVCLAPFHRLHHLQRRKSAVNYGIIFNVTDMLLGTYLWSPEECLDEDKLGISNYPDYPTGYVDQLIHPFSSQKHSPKKSEGL